MSYKQKIQLTSELDDPSKTKISQQRFTIILIAFIDCVKYKERIIYIASLNFSSLFTSIHRKQKINLHQKIPKQFVTLTLSPGRKYVIDDYPTDRKNKRALSDET